MKKTKQLLAIIGIILLILMYASTLVFAIIDNSKTLGLFKASVACTILVPILLYVYTMIYKLTNKKDKED